MLRRVFLENFVEFKDKQTINFEENGSPNIFIGENGSGKSSLLEGIRRCLSSATSTTRSSVYDKQKPSYYVCKYDTSKCCEKELSDIEPASMFTGILTITTADEEYFKFVSTPTELLIDKYSSTGARSSFHTMNTDQARQMNIDLQTNMLDHNKITSNLNNLRNDSCVEEMLTMLEKYIVLTFPLRSIGPCHWSKSIRIAEDKRDENYLEASHRSEVIMYFLEHPSEFDPDKDNEYFTALTGRNDITFKLSPNSNGQQSILVESNSNTKLPGGKFALLKMPEGILEAKYFSILMSSKQFQTVIVEEPERGMHPQMIERMLAILQKESTTKMIVLTTHNPCFVKPSTISQLTIFKRLRPPAGNSTDKDRTEIIPDLSHIFREDRNKPKQNLSDQPGMKTLRLLTRDHLTEFIFAKRILFCEGDSDFLFLTTLKELFMKLSLGSYRALQIVSIDAGIGPVPLAAITSLQKVLVSIQIININGWNNAGRMHKLCTDLKFDDHFFVCDKDSIVENGKVKHDNRWMKNYENVEKLYNEQQNAQGDQTSSLEVGRQEKWENARKMLREECKCYTWRDGTIEDMAMSLLRTETRRSVEEGMTHIEWTENQNVIDELKEQFVILPVHRWRERREKEKKKDDERDKLFLSKEVTQENITKSVEIFLMVCKNKSDDLVQFLQFMSEMAIV